MSTRGLLVLMIPLLPGCGCDDLGFGDQQSEPPPGPSWTPPNQPPTLDARLPSWPPRDGDQGVWAIARDDRGLRSVEASFLKRADKQITGVFREVRFTPEELGEGFGTLTLRAQDSDGLRSELVEVRDFLVDLTPPSVEAGPPILRADGEGDRGTFKIWASDAWVLGGMELEYRGYSRNEELTPGTTSALGAEWDRALFEISAKDLPPGKGEMIVNVRDFVGHVVMKRMEVLVDASPPRITKLEVTSTSSDATQLEVIAGAEDDEGPATIDLFVGGTIAATVTGTAAVVILDRTEFASGPLRLDAIARDQAGYESPPVSLELAW